MVSVYDGWYLLDNHMNLGTGNTLPWYTTRRRPVTAIVIHTPETLEDFDPPYDEAERVARYGASTTRASWHATIDADSIIPMLPSTYTAWQVRGYNSHTVGYEIGARATSWAKAPKDWVTGVLENAASYARKDADRFGIPARFLTRAEVDAGKKGFTSHAQLDPERRTDPGKDFPWDRFLGLVEGDDMTPKQAEFLNEMIASAEAVGTNGFFVKPTVELVRAHSSIVAGINKRLGTIENQLRDIRNDGDGSLPQAVLDDIADVKADVEQIVRGLAEAAGAV